MCTLVCKQNEIEKNINHHYNNIDFIYYSNQMQIFDEMSRLIFDLVLPFFHFASETHLIWVFFVYSKF